MGYNTIQHDDVCHSIYIRYTFDVFQGFPQTEAGDSPPAGTAHGHAWPSLEAEDSVPIGPARSRIWGWLGLVVKCKIIRNKNHKMMKKIL